MPLCNPDILYQHHIPDPSSVISSKVSSNGVMHDLPGKKPCRYGLKRLF